MGELNDLAESVAALLKERGDTLAVSESSCGGLISAALVSIPGASAYYVGGSVVYTRTAQQGLLQVPDSAMEGPPGQHRVLRAAECPHVPRDHGHHMGAGRNGRQRADRKPLRRQLRARLLRRCRTRGEVADAGDREPGTRREHVGICPHGSCVAGRSDTVCLRAYSL